MSTQRAVALLCIIAGLGTLSAYGTTTPGSTANPSTSSVAEPAGPLVDLVSGGDDFNDPASLTRWAAIQGDLLDGQASQADISTTAPGALRVSAARMGLTGLLVRAPRGTTPRENWIGYTAGFVSGPVTESKTTRDGRSVLKLNPVQPGWIELRIVRVRHMFVLLRRQADQAWVMDAAYLRPDLPDTVQIGVNAGSGSESDRADLIAEADWIHFAPHNIPSEIQTEVVATATTSPQTLDRLMVRSGDQARIRERWWPYLTA